MSETNQDTPTEIPTEQQQKSELSINDLHSLRAVIDLASSRGAFKPAEMMAVGQAYSKLANFLDSIQTTTTGQ